MNELTNDSNYQTLDKSRVDRAAGTKNPAHLEPLVEVKTGEAWALLNTQPARPSKDRNMSIDTIACEAINAMQAILGWGEVLLEDPQQHLARDQKKIIGRMMENTRQLNTLICCLARFTYIHDEK